MSQYGSPPPPPESSGGPGDGDRTRVPGTHQPAWEHPTTQDATPAADPWDQPPPARAPSAPPQSWDQPAYPAQQPYQAPYQQAPQPDPGPQGPWSTPTTSGGVAAAEAKGLVGALFDFSFDTFVTGRIVKVVYVLAIVGLSLGLLGWLASAIATGSPLLIVFALVAGPVGFVVYLCFVRMLLELFLAVTRLSEDVHLTVPDRRDRP